MQVEVGKVYVTLSGEFATVVSKHPRKYFYSAQTHKIDILGVVQLGKEFYVNSKGDYDLSGNAQPSSLDLIDLCDFQPGQVIVFPEMKQDNISFEILSVIGSVKNAQIKISHPDKSVDFLYAKNWTVRDLGQMYLQPKT